MFLMLLVVLLGVVVEQAVSDSDGYRRACIFAERKSQRTSARSLGQAQVRTSTQITSVTIPKSGQSGPSDLTTHCDKAQG
jgi:hypothetical protein